LSDSDLEIRIILSDHYKAVGKFHSWFITTIEDNFSKEIENTERLAKKMHQTGKQRFLILAGNMNDERFRLKPVIGTMLEMVFQYEIAIIPVMNVEATIAYAIHSIMTKVDGKKPPSVNYTHTRNYNTGLDRNTNREMFQSIPGIGIKRAFAIEKSEFNTMEKLVNASRAQLASIPQVGKKSAETIYNTLRKKPSVVNKRKGLS